jgi:hypothetical protein
LAFGSTGSRGPIAAKIRQKSGVAAANPIHSKQRCATYSFVEEIPQTQPPIGTLGPETLHQCAASSAAELRAYVNTGVLAARAHAARSAADGG